MVAAKRADFKGIGERFGIDQVTARIIRNRDVIGEKAIEKYLHGSRKDFYSPWLLKDMEKAVAILQEKIENRKLKSWHENCNLSSEIMILTE